MTVDLSAVRAHLREAESHYEDGDESEFVLAAVDLLQDVPELIASVERLQVAHAEVVSHWQTSRESHALTVRKVEQYRLLWEERGTALLEQIEQTKTVRAERDQLKSALVESERRYVEVCTELQERVP